MLPLTTYGALSQEKIELIRLGQQAMLNSDWARAKNIYENLFADLSDNPAGCLFRAALLQAEMIDREEDLHGRRLKTLCDSTKVLSEKKLHDCSPRDSALCYLYIGHQYAYRSFWEARFGSKFSALNFGFRAKGQYRKGLKVDSTLYDLYLGLGSYHYWKSVKSGFLKWLRIFKDERELGIDEIKLAAEKSLFSQEAALSALIGIMINEKKYDSALSMAERMYQRFPDGISFFWPTASAYFESERYQKAFEYYDKILARLKSSPGNYYNIIEALYYLKKCAEKSDDTKIFTPYRLYLDSIYDKIPKKIRRKQKGKLSFIKRN